MELHAKLVRSQLNFFKPLAENCSLELTRKGQDKLGELMTAMHRRETFSREHDFRNFQGAWIMPKDERRTGVILYLHGGGYTCGSLEYAKGFASTLATECGGKVVAVGGNSVTVEYARADGSRVQCTYMHLGDMAVKAGDTVQAGQRLGTAGKDGGHLHFGVRQLSADGTQRDVDPAAYLAEIARKGNLKQQALHDGNDLLA